MDGANGYGNRNTIGVEICRNYDRSRGTTNLNEPLRSQYTKAEENTIKVVPQVMIDLGIAGTLDNIKVHNDWSGKWCPRKILNEGRLPDFKAKIIAEYVRLKSGGKAPAPTPKPTPSNPSTYTVKAGDTLWGIANKFSGVSVANIKGWNNLKSDLIKSGQVLKMGGGTKAPEPKPTPTPTPAPSSGFKVGERVQLKNSAKTYATGQNIPASVKGKTYTIMQVGSGRVLLQEILSWVRNGDVAEQDSSNSAHKPAPKANEIKVGARVLLPTSAKTYATGEPIPASRKGKTYTIQQISGNRALLQELVSWVRISDLTGGSSSSGSSNSGSGSSSIKAGDRVTVNSSARTYATGQNIPESVRGKTYTVQQVGNGRVLLKEIVSWVRTGDVTKGGGSSSSNPAPKNITPKVGDKVRIKQSARTYATGQTIPASRKGVRYTVQQTRSGQSLLREIVSWVRNGDLEK